MNILPKKRWHVRTKDNIARVRRDEAQAAEEENQRINRAKLAEKEARTAFLRNRARLGHDGGPEEPQAIQGPAPKPSNPPKTVVEADIYTSQGNINFFKDAEEGRHTGTATNKEHEAEKKALQEKYEKSIGYLTYLGQDSVEASGGRAWYEQEAGKVVRDADNEKDCSDIGEVGLKSKNKMDPIHDIIKYGGFKTAPKDIKTSKGISTITTDIVKQVKTEVINLEKSSVEKMNVQKSEVKRKKHKKRHKKDTKKRRKEKKRSSKRKRRTYTSDESAKEGSRHSSERQTSIKRKRRGDSSDEEDECQRKRRKISKNKKSKGRKKRHSSSSTGSSNSASNNESSSSAYSSEDEEAALEKKKKLETLRAERLRREAEERRRAEKLLAGKQPDKEVVTKENNPAFTQKYHSQYNPHIARQNQEPSTGTLQSGVKYWLQ